jgi:excisionase family DNA binding protein
MATLVPQRSYLTVPETASQLRVSPKTIYRLIANAELPVVRVGAQIRIEALELEVWLQGASGRNGPT